MRKPEQEQKQQCGHRGNHRAPCSDTRWRLCKKSRRLPLPPPPRVWYPARTSSPLLQPSRLRWQSSSRNSGAGMWNQQTCQLYRRRVGCTQRLLRGWICRIPERNWLLEMVPFFFFFFLIDHCLECGESRYKSKDGKGFYKRCSSMFMSKHIVVDMQWHKENCIDIDGVLRHLANVDRSKDFDKKNIISLLKNFRMLG